MDEIYPQLMTYLNGIWRRRWIALVLTWIMALVGWAVVALLPDTYASSGRIYVDTASVLKPLLRGIAVDDDVQSEIDVMKRTLLSRPNLEKVARTTDLDITATTDEEMELLIERLRENTSVSGAGDNLFFIEFEGPNPQLAKDIVQSLITIFIERNLGDTRVDMDSARQFLDQQIDAYEQQLEAAEQRTARFKQQNLALLPGDNGYNGRLEKAKEAVASAESALKEAITQRDVLRRELAEVPQYLEFQSDQQLTGPGPPSDTEVRIVENEVLLQELKSVFTDQHPDVIKVQRRLDSLRAEQDAEFERALEGSGPAGSEAAPVNKFRTANPLHDQLRVRVIEQDANVQILQEKLRDRERKLTDMAALASSVPIVEAEFIKLNRDYEVLQRKYQELLSRREAARISQDRENQADKVQFRIVEPPQVPAFPSGPNRALFLFAATVMALGTGFGFAFLLTLISPTFANARQLADHFGLPVVGVVGAIGSGWGRPLRAANAVMFLLAFLTVPIALGVLLQVERQVGLGRLDLAKVNTVAITDLASNVQEASENMIAQLMNRL